MALGPTSRHCVHHLPVLPGPLLPFRQPLPPSAEGHPSPEGHEQAEGEGQEQDGEQAALLRLLRPPLSRLQSHSCQHELQYLGRLRPPIFHGERERKEKSGLLTVSQCIFFLSLDSHVFE